MMTMRKAEREQVWSEEDEEKYIILVDYQTEPEVQKCLQEFIYRDFGLEVGTPEWERQGDVHKEKRK